MLSSEVELLATAVNTVNPASSSASALMEPSQSHQTSFVPAAHQNSPSIDNIMANSGSMSQSELLDSMGATGRNPIAGGSRRNSNKKKIKNDSNSGAPLLNASDGTPEMPEQDASNSNNENKPHSRVLTGLQFSLMLFLVTAAGPFGIESLLHSSSPFYALLGIVVLPIIYCLPQSLMCAELSAMIPENHGSVAWVYRGLGNYCGFIYCVNDSFSTLTDIPTYLVLIGAYCKSWLKHTFEESALLDDMIVYLFMVSLALIASILNVLDISVIGNLSILLTLLIIVPLVVGFFMVLPDLEPKVWLETTPVDSSCSGTEGVCDWSLYFSSLIWLYTGWDTLSNINGEVSFDLSRFLRTFIYAILIDTASYGIPLITVFTVSYPKSNGYDSVSEWKDGYLNSAYFKIDYVLGIFVFIGGVVSNYSIHLCESCTLAREIWAMAQDHAPRASAMNVLDADAEGSIAIGVLPKCFGYLYKRTNAPVVAILLIFLANCGLVTFSFNFLIELGTVQNCFSFVFEYSSLIALRYYEPNEPRPFKIPGGMTGVWALTLIKFALIATLLVTVSIEEPEIILFCLGYNVLLSVYYFLWVRPRNKRRIEQSRMSLTGSSVDGSGSGSGSVNGPAGMHRSVIDQQERV